ncbi:MAG: TRAP transporter large permease subunit [Bosea sp.]|uniref:TRAP transporter large permease subunit n=1 Tax=Bosea sp. (in: a-proteobacteria) TaxID=1871050 RepID=UPI002392E63C|nr:TRAP transporter large permease subunit [Bosea sp. (in: a-proteobacteria)]MCP4736733.1 TRAP transporter large permease subunit [Bosea sp. (in: a-proteobacteria)]
MSQWIGLVMLAGVALGAITTGLPVWGVLISLATLGAAASVALDPSSAALLAALPSRIVGLLEADLLQALPLFVFMGALLNRLPLARILFRTALRPFGGARGATLALGAILGPMNGSVSANAIALTRAIEPALAEHEVPPAESIALLTVASTLGVLVPPSLVLILLGDAMMAAHTIALTATGRADRIINTQDVFRGAMLPAGLFLAACLVLAFLHRERGRRLSVPTPGEAVLALLAVGFIGGLLVGVALGYFYAVEAAAMGAVGLLTAGLLSRQLDLARLKTVLDDTLAMTGALMALLVAATTFTLVFRILGSDRLVASWMEAVPGGSLGILGAGLGLIVLAAFVLDAFEIIFVLVPILLPPILMRVEDAQWVAVLTLLVLQTSFLLPPLGYALTMTRAAATRRAPLRAAMAALAPFILAQLLVTAAVVCWPSLAHLGQSPAPAAAAPSEADVARRLGEIAPPAGLMDIAPPKF